MDNHKVVNIKITYEPGNMSDGEEKSLEESIEAFLNSIKGKKGIRVKAKKHDVAVNIMLDEYGIETE